MKQWAELQEMVFHCPAFTVMSHLCVAVARGQMNASLVGAFAWRSPTSTTQGPMQPEWVDRREWRQVWATREWAPHGRVRWRRCEWQWCAPPVATNFDWHRTAMQWPLQWAWMIFGIPPGRLVECSPSRNGSESWKWPTHLFQGPECHTRCEYNWSIHMTVAKNHIVIL